MFVISITALVRSLFWEDTILFICNLWIFASIISFFSAFFTHFFEYLLGKFGRDFDFDFYLPNYKNNLKNKWGTVWVPVSMLDGTGKNYPTGVDGLSHNFPIITTQLNQENFDKYIGELYEAHRLYSLSDKTLFSLEHKRRQLLHILSWIDKGGSAISYQPNARVRRVTFRHRGMAVHKLQKVNSDIFSITPVRNNHFHRRGSIMDWCKNYHQTFNRNDRRVLAKTLYLANIAMREHIAEMSNDVTLQLQRYQGRMFRANPETTNYLTEQIMYHRQKLDQNKLLDKPLIDHHKKLQNLVPTDPLIMDRFANDPSRN